MNIKETIHLMEKFTDKYKEGANLSKSEREIACLNVLYPELFTKPEENDLFTGRFIQLPVGMGLEWAHLGGSDLEFSSIDKTIVNGSSAPETGSAGSSYYGIVNRIENLKEFTADESLHNKIDQMVEFWKENDTHISMIRQFRKSNAKELYPESIDDFHNPLLLLTRLSGIEMDYSPLLKLGIEGFTNNLNEKRDNNNRDFIDAGVAALNLLNQTIEYYITILTNLEPSESNQLMLNSLKEIKERPPVSFHGAIQLVFLYSQLAGVVNYGRMDIYLGEFLENDLQNNKITKDEALTYLESLWMLIDAVCNRGNGRVIVGGEGVEHLNSSRLFTELAIKATINTSLPKPQLTYRMGQNYSQKIYDLALDAIEKGCTFPMIYNDELNIPAVAKSMDIPLEDAVNYIPYGCGEYVIWGKGTGSPNACINFVKGMQLAFNNGVDPYDNTYRGGNYNFKTPEYIKDFREFKNEYFRYLKYLLKTSADFQKESYEKLADNSAFIYSSLLMDNCINAGKPILDGGIKYYSGVIEFYGFTNAIDSLMAIKKLVFDDEKYTLKEFLEIVHTNYNGNRRLLEEILQYDKFGNDLTEVDNLGIELHEFACNYVRDYGREIGLHSFLAVNINNNANTRWGIKTAASPDGRSHGEHLAPGNNPHSGRDNNGITPMLNSISKFRADIHAGYVQNLKISPKLFKKQRPLLKTLFNVYFSRPGGTQLMINVVNQETLLAALKTPEQYKNLLVRCGGFSARFVELDKRTQQEIINRTCND